MNYNLQCTKQKMAKGKKTGGRKAGSLNKVTAAMRSILKDKTDAYFSSKGFDEDLADLEPKDRLAIMEKLLQYTTPKLQATTLDVAENMKETIEDRLLALSSSE